jgi:hypothetical protein
MTPKPTALGLLLTSALAGTDAASNDSFDYQSFDEPVFNVDGSSRDNFDAHHFLPTFTVLNDFMNSEQEIVGKLRVLIPKLEAREDLFERFKLAPEEVAKQEVGLSLPAGFHMHYIDKAGNYFPPEILIDRVSDPSPLNWSRAEFQVSGPRSGKCGLCVFCKE